MKRVLPDEAATNAMAEQLLNAMPTPATGWILLLQGDLGAGKSTFARAFIRAAGHEGPIPSPTYTLVEPYDSSIGKIYHIDLYRITEESELRYLGWNELEDGCRLIEWPERSPGLVNTADLCIHLSYDGPGRIASMTSISARGAELLAAIPRTNRSD